MITEIMKITSSLVMAENMDPAVEIRYLAFIGQLPLLNPAYTVVLLLRLKSFSDT